MPPADTVPDKDVVDGTVVGVPVVTGKVAGPLATAVFRLTVSGEHALAFSMLMRLPIKKLVSVAPKLNEVGVTEIVGGGVGVPLPERFTARLGFAGSSLATVMTVVADPVAVGVKVTCTLALPPAGTVREEGVRVNEPDGRLIPLTASDIAPVLLTVRVWLAERHTATFPKFIEVVETWMCGRPPVPVSETLIEGLVGSFVFAVSMPLKPVSALGEKVTFKGEFPPAGTVRVVNAGVKRALVLAMLVIWRAWPPVFSIVRACMADVPTRTTPKARLAGTTAFGGAGVPVPVSETVTVGLEGSLVFIVRLALKVAAELGVKVILIVALPPAATVTVVGEGTNLGLELATPDICSGCPPVFWIVNGRVDGVPTVTLPNVRFAATTAWGGVGGV